MKIEHSDFGFIPTSWEVLTLGDVADITKLAGFEFTKHIEYLEEGEIIALRSLNVVNGQLDLSNVKRISKAASDALPRSKLFADDILLTYTGSILGDVAIIDTNDKYHLAPNVCRLRAKENDDTYFLYHFMRTKKFAQILDNFKVGSGQPTVPMTNIRKIPIIWPDNSTRRLICEICNPFNSKASVDKQIKRILDEIAQVTFRSWLIDFDPVKAKAEGALPHGMDKETAALFPDSFQDSELGPIPFGWKLCSILELGDFLNGVASQKYPVISENDSLPVIKIREMQNGITENSDRASTSTPQKYHINEGEILFSWAATLLVQHWQGNKAILNQHIFKVTPSENFPEWFVYQYLTSELWKFQRMATAGETMMGHIKRKDLQQHLVILPSIELLKKLSQTMIPLYSLSKSISINQKYPAAILDALLTRLMSGELKVN